MLVRNVRSRSSSKSESKPPRVSPTKPPAKASIGAFGDVETADGLARETRVEFDVLDAGLAAVSFALFSKSRRTALIELASPCNC